MAPSCRAVVLPPAAPPEGPLEQQWQQLDGAADVLALAPDDEVLAELLALQVRRGAAGLWGSRCSSSIAQGQQLMSLWESTRGH